MTMNCPECGRGEVRPNHDQDRRWSFRTIPDLELPVEVEIPTCAHCGEQWIDGDTDAALDAGLERAFRATVLEKAKRAIDTLRETFGHRQRTVERALGLSHGYLSKIIAKERDPSPTLVAALLLLANDAGRLEELRASWSTRGREALKGAATRRGHLRLVPDSGAAGPYTVAGQPADVRVASSGERLRADG